MTFIQQSRDTPTMKLPPAPAPSPSARAFFTAVHAFRQHSAQPHPVFIRNIGLVPAWQQWDTQKALQLDDLLASPELRFSQGRDMVTKALRADPAYQNGQVVLPLNRLDQCAAMARIAAPLMFWRRQHTLFELTAALEHLLARSDLGDDIPVDLFRSPVPACFIRFGAELQRVIVPLETDQGIFKLVEGAYVFESVYAHKRVISMVPVYASSEHTGVGVGMVEMILDDERVPLVDAIRRIETAESTESWRHNQSVAQLCVKVLPVPARGAGAAGGRFILYRSAGATSARRPQEGRPIATANRQAVRPRRPRAANAAYPSARCARGSVATLAARTLPDATVWPAKRPAQGVYSSRQC